MALTPEWKKSSYYKGAEKEVKKAHAKKKELAKKIKTNKNDVESYKDKVYGMMDGIRISKNK